MGNSYSTTLKSLLQELERDDIPLRSAFWNEFWANQIAVTELFEMMTIKDLRYLRSTQRHNFNALVAKLCLKLRALTVTLERKI